MTKEQIKAEIDKVQDEYLDALLRVVRAFDAQASHARNASGDEGHQTAPGAAARQSLEALAEIRSSKLTREEVEILDDFEAFRREHPLRLVSLDEER